MKLNEVLTKTIDFFKSKKMDSPRLEAELLLAHALKIPRIQLYVKFEQPLNETEITNCREVVRRRAQGEPVAYIIEEQGFYGLIFKVNKEVLIPRPETEMIVDQVLKFAKLKDQSEIRILDIGAGTGCVGLSLIKNLPQAKLVAIEKSDAAFQVLQENVNFLFQNQFDHKELNQKINLIHADANEVDYSALGTFDFIVSNPPYIAIDDSQIEPHVKQFEPALALFAEDNGLKFIKEWSKKSSRCLKPTGFMFFEIGSTQGQEAKNYFESLPQFSTETSSVEVLKDLSGLDRIVKARA